MRIELLIDGINPVPWTAPSYGRGNVFKSQGLTAYQTALQECIAEAFPDYPTFPKGTQLCADFYFRRQLDSGTTGEGVRRRARGADRSNLLKATEDALQRNPKTDWRGLFWNDKMIVDGKTVIIEQGPDVTPFIHIVIEDGFKFAKVDYGDFSEMNVPIPPGNVWMVIR